ncbi:MAG: GPI ethanolamine phosphate transferase 3, partial [bacterium]
MLNRVHLALLHAIALALFAHGFLLTRVHLPRERYSSAGGAPAGGGGLHHDARGRDGHFEGRGASVENGVGQPARQASMPSYRKLVWVVVDALRYDFVVDDARYGHSKRNADMPFLSSFVRGQDCLDGASHPGCGRDVAEYARVARFIADAPTTTTQRLMSMTTGSLPIFFDVSSAFSASAVGEDNLIDGLRSAGRRLVFMGDSTWDSLYPTQFHASYPFPCYNIMDLHSVDEGVNELLVPAVRNMTGGEDAAATTWDVVVAHYLGVDHAGHAFGVDSPQMRAKLRQIDESIREGILALESSEDTLVLVVGDHGQTITGDHGGGGPEEVDSVLVAVDVDAYFGRTLERIDGRAGPRRQGPGTGTGSASASLSKPLLACMESCTCGEGGNQCVPDVNQIDMVPTLAGLMGIPIPFVNLGKVSAEIWSLLDDDRDGSFVRILGDNTRQVHRYLDTYAQQPRAQLPSGAMKALGTQFAALSSKSSAQAQIDFLSAAEDLARRAWTQFHEGWMVAGAVCAVAAVVCHGVMLVEGVSGRQRSRPAIPRDAATNSIPWVISMIHPVGIFSFFFLLSEGTYTSWIVILSAASVYWPRRRNPSATTGLILTCTACLLASSAGLQSHSGFAFWQRLTVHDEDVESHDGGPVFDDGEPTALGPPLGRLAIHYVIPTIVLTHAFRAYTATRGLLRGVETIYRVYLAGGVAAMLAYHATINAVAHGESPGGEDDQVDGHVPAQVCYAFIAALLILSVGARLVKRLTRSEFLVVLCGTLALLVALISPAATPLVLLGLFGEVYGVHLMCTATHTVAPVRAANRVDDTVDDAVGDAVDDAVD